MDPNYNVRSMFGDLLTIKNINVFLHIYEYIPQRYWAWEKSEQQKVSFRSERIIKI